MRNYPVFEEGEGNSQIRRFEIFRKYGEDVQIGLLYFAVRERSQMTSLILGPLQEPPPPTFTPVTIFEDFPIQKYSPGHISSPNSKAPLPPSG